MSIKRDKRSQKGEAELMFFGLVLVVCAIISGSLALLNWIKDTKNERVRSAHLARLAKARATPFSPRPDPAAYLAHCEKPSWTLLQTKYPCDVLPESYGELYVIDDEFYDG